MKPGAVFHGYSIEELLHHGADGEIYAARDSGGNAVALKIPLGGGFGNLRRYASYRTEWELAGRLDHHRIVDFRRGEGRFFVMERLTGTDLRSRLHSRGRLDWAEAERYLVEICEGLAYLHGKGIVHHDLKPENIMIDDRLGVKLLDFGLAFCPDLDDPLGALDEPIGTPYYIAPEQLEGVRGSSFSDIYSIGVTLYEMITGELPFEKSTTQRGARKRLYVEPIPPRIHRPDLPCGIQELLFLLLDRDPFSRPKASNISQAIRGGIDWATIACVTPERSALDRWMDHFRIWKTPKYRNLSAGKLGQVDGYHILAVINDEVTADTVVRCVKDEALRRDATVTLVVIVPFNLPDFDRGLVEKAMIKKVDEGLTALGAGRIKCRFYIKTGDPESEILRYAESRNVDLIALAPRDFSVIRNIVGARGLTERIVKNAAANVLVVKK